MQITIIHRYFWPDNAPYAQMLFRIASSLVADGHHVHVISSQPSHGGKQTEKAPKKETINGIKISRLKLFPEKGRRLVIRAINTVIFTLNVFARLLFKPNHVIMVASTPPVVIAAAVRWASNITGARYIYHCQDIHPEAINTVNTINSSILYNFLRSIDKTNVDKSVTTIVLSDDMANTLVDRGSDRKKIRIINNFIFEDPIQLDRPDLVKRDKFNLLFAGNLGRFQNLDLIIDAAILLADQDNINFIFVGNGIEQANLHKRSSELLGKTVHFAGKVSLEKALSFMDHADLGLISVADQVIRVAYPSKTMMYLSRGLPLMALVEESEISDYILDNNIGFVCNSNDPKTLADTILQASFKQSQLRGERDRIKNIAHTDFGMKKVLLKWQSLYNEINTNG